MSFNIVKTGLLLAAMSGVLVAMGGLIGGQMGMLIALGIAAAMNVFSYWNSDKLVLRMHGAQRVDATTAPDLYNMVEVMSRQAGLPMPAVYIMQNDQPNAFATGRNPENSAVAATTGLLNRLSREEVAGVMAHELAHIKNRDTLIMTVAATIAGAIGMLANMLQFQMLFGGTRDNNNPLGWIGLIAAMFLAPMAAMIVQMAISRTREYKADRVGAEICGNPLWLASALESIQAGASRIPNEPAEAAPATAHMFIINPLVGRRFDNLFSTHPNTQNRVAALEQLARDIGMTGSASGQGGFAGESHDGTGDPGPWGRSPSRETDQSSRGPWG